jgi:hypothetical protein
VRVEAVTNDAYTESPLSRMIYKGSAPWGFLSLSDHMVRTRRILESAPSERLFVRTYYDGIDAVAHRYGPLSAEHHAEVAAIDAALEREIVRKVEDPGALFILTADHGHTTALPERQVALHDHRDFLRHLALPPTGEGRFAYLHVRPGHVEAARAYVEKVWPEVPVVGIREAADAGLFGPGPEHPEFERRAGDLLLLPGDSVRFTTDYGAARAPTLVGVHGGLSREEMLVPLLYRRLG